MYVTPDGEECSFDAWVACRNVTPDVVIRDYESCFRVVYTGIWHGNGVRKQWSVEQATGREWALVACASTRDSAVRMAEIALSAIQEQRKQQQHANYLRRRARAVASAGRDHKSG